MGRAGPASGRVLRWARPLELARWAWLPAWWRGLCRGADRCQSLTKSHWRRVETFSRKGEKHLAPPLAPCPCPGGRWQLVQHKGADRLGGRLLLSGPPGPQSQAAAAHPVWVRKEGWPQLTPPRPLLRLPCTHPAAWDPQRGPGFEVGRGGSSQAPGRTYPVSPQASRDSSRSSSPGPKPPVTLPCWALCLTSCCWRARLLASCWQGQGLQVPQAYLLSGAAQS